MFTNHHICVVSRSTVCHIGNWECSINVHILKSQFYACILDVLKLHQRTPAMVLELVDTNLRGGK